MRKEITTVALAGMAVLIMSGCSARGPQFSGFKKPAYGQANVYVYRTSYLGAAVTPEIHKTSMTDYRDEIIGSIKPDGYIMTTISPGMYRFWAKTEAENEVKLKAYPNKIYCIEHYISIGFLIGHPQFKLVDMEKCKREIKKTKLSLSEPK